MALFEELKKPVVVISLLLGISSLVLSYLLYLKSQQSRRPTYLVSDKRYKIFDAGIKSPKLRLLDENNNLVNEDVYVAEVTFWNSGNLPIQSSDIRQPIRILVTGCKKILDYEVVHQTHPQICNFLVYADTIDRFPSGVEALRVHWELLDPGFGARIKIVYSGKQDAVISMDGYILGVSSFVDATSLGERSSTVKVLKMGIIFFVVLFEILVITLAGRPRTGRFTPKAYRHLIWYLSAFVAILLLVYFYLRVGPEPPF
jgi:hypothetical protein